MNSIEKALQQKKQQQKSGVNNLSSENNTQQNLEQAQSKQSIEVNSQTRDVVSSTNKTQENELITPIDKQQPSETFSDNFSINNQIEEQKDNKADLIEKITEQNQDANLKQGNEEKESLAVADVKTSKEVTIDLKLLESLGFLVPSNSHTIINEEYRQIKRPLIRNIKGKSAHKIERANVIQVTSSLQSEGKTFTAINLALAFAMELDFNVLLVDADTIKSSITRTLINTTEIGLTDYLTGDVDDLSEIMLKTNIPKLTILPAGKTHLLSPELLNSEYMDKLIVEFSQRYENRIVIFDSPPLLQTNDSRILSQKVGQLVFVVEQNKTEQSIVKSALSLLDPEMVIGVVMNKTRNNSRHGYYGYYAPNE